MLVSYENKFLSMWTNFTIITEIWTTTFMAMVKFSVVVNTSANNGRGSASKQAVLKYTNVRSLHLLFRCVMDETQITSGQHSKVIRCHTRRSELCREYIHTLEFSRVSVWALVWHLFPDLLCLWTNDLEYRTTYDNLLRYIPHRSLY